MTACGICGSIMADVDWVVGWDCHWWQRLPPCCRMILISKPAAVTNQQQSIFGCLDIWFFCELAWVELEWHSFSICCWRWSSSFSFFGLKLIRNVIRNALFGFDYPFWLIRLLITDLYFGIYFWLLSLVFCTHSLVAYLFQLSLFFHYLFISLLLMFCR